jgi:Toprim domain/CHC2 zinc finger/DNA polymerase family A
MPVIFWDIETRSTLALETIGAWRYAADPTTEVLCVGFAVDEAEPEIWTPGQPIPPSFITAAADPNWLIVAHNYAFERTIETRILAPRYGWPQIPIAQQRCSMTLALANALPGGLDAAAAALGLAIQKDAEGYKLMRKMSRPLPKRKRDAPGEIRWRDTPEARKRLALYCKQDVSIERMVFNALPPMPPAEQEHWELDATINARGFCTDIALAVAARDLARNERRQLNAEIANLTNGEITSIDQVARIQAYVERHGHQLMSLNKRSVAAVLAHEPSEAVRCVLELRREGARASVRKLERLLTMVDADSRLRGSLRFHAAHTGRWSGRGYQPQNLKRPETKDLDAAVDAVLSGDRERIRELGAPLTIAGDVQRSVICAAPGHRLIAGDFSAIESRVLAWLANEKWKLETYRKYDETSDPQFEPYCVLASQALKRTVTPDDAVGRQFGKTYDLAFGFGGGRGAWRKFDTSDTYSDAEIESFKHQFRRTHRATFRFWHALERVAHRTVRTKQRTALGNQFCFDIERGTLFMTLPSGRRLAYPEARMVPGKFEETRNIRHKDNADGAWADTDTWYGTLVENAVQAVARDLLVAAMQRLEAAGYKVVLHVHDEIVCEVPEDFGSEDEFLRLMLELPDWAAGLPIAGKVRSGKRYAKSSSKRAPETTTQTEPLQLQVSFLGVAEIPSEANERASGHPTGSSSEYNLIDAEDDANDADEDDDGEDGEGDDDDNADVSLADLINEELTDGMMSCPFHTDIVPSMKIYHDHYHCFGCGAHGDRIDWLMAIEKLSRAEAVHLLKTWDGPVTPKPSALNDEISKRTFALQLWKQAHPIAGTLAARYLTDIRGVDLTALSANIDEALRFHPRCSFGPGMRHPCMLALMRNAVTDVPVGVQRIAFTADANKIDRRMLGNHGVVKLWPAGKELIIGEGLETVLAAASRVPYDDKPLQPAWAALSANMLGGFPVLNGVERLIILVDHDEAGLTAAATCEERWTRAGRTVVQLTPDRPGEDFNDLVLQELAL